MYEEESGRGAARDVRASCAAGSVFDAEVRVNGGASRPAGEEMRRWTKYGEVCKQGEREPAYGIIT